MASAAEMVSAGVILGVLAAFSGELGRVAVSGQSVLALGYLIVFGSLLAYTAYTWLLDHVAPRIAGTYAFVNPVVAVFLGWWLLDERLDARVIGGTVVIAVAVALIVLAPVSDPQRSKPALSFDRQQRPGQQSPPRQTGTPRPVARAEASPPGAGRSGAG